MKKFQDDKAASDEISNVYKKNKFLTIDQDLGSKDGSLGYTIKGSTEGLKGFVREVKNTRIYKALHDCDSSFTFDENDIKASDNKDDETKVEVWVDRWSHQITKVAAKDESGSDKASFVLEPVFNKPVNVTAPEKSVTLSDLKSEIEGLMQSMYSGMAAQEPADMDL